MIGLARLALMPSTGCLFAANAMRTGCIPSCASNDDSDEHDGNGSEIEVTWQYSKASHVVFIIYVMMGLRG